MNNERNRQLYLLLGKALVDAVVEIAGGDRIRFTAVQKQGIYIVMEEALAKNKHPDLISEEVGCCERTVRRYRDDKLKQHKK